MGEGLDTWGYTGVGGGRALTTQGEMAGVVVVVKGGPLGHLGLRLVQHRVEAAGGIGPR